MDETKKRGQTLSQRLVAQHPGDAELERRRQAYLAQRRQRAPHLVRVHEHLKRGGTRQDFDS